MKTLLLALCLSSCAPHWTYVQDTGSNTAHPYRVCIPDPAVSLQVAPAVDAWRTALAGWRPVVLECPGDVTIEVTGPEACDPGALGCTDTLGGSRVNLVRGHWDAGVVSHELGHALGAQHAPGLMAAQYEPGHLCPDMTTIVQVASYQRANLTRFSWCY